MSKITNEITWVVFDLGGIVVPENGGLINDEMAAYLSISPHQLSNFTRRYERGMTIGRMSLLEMYSDLIRELFLPSSPEDVLKHHCAFYRQVSTHHNSDIIWIIETLKKCFGVACLTNIETEIAEICRETGLFDYFHKAFLSVDMGMQKPDREVYEAVVRNIGCSADNVIFIDDKMENVQAAKDVGMLGLLFCDAEQLRIAMSCFCPLLLNKDS